MLYLEDYLEIIEHLPQELRDRFTEIRELDLAVQNNVDSLEKRQQAIFNECRRETSTTGVEPSANLQNEFKSLMADYYKTLEDADEKVQIANHMYELVERYLRRLDQELHKFKCELEADHSGITQVLEKRSLELDTPQNNQLSTLQTTSNQLQKENRYRPRNEKRRDSGSSNSIDKRLTSLATNTGLANINLAAQQVLSAGTGIIGNQLNSSELRSHNLLNTSANSLQSTASANAMLAAAGLQTSLGTKTGPSTNVSYNIAGNVIAAAASQAIVATQQLQQGRRTASLKASYEAINTGVHGHELSIGRDLAGAAQTALQSIQQDFKDYSSVSKRQKKSVNRKWTTGSSSSSNSSQHQQIASTLSEQNSNANVVNDTSEVEAAVDDSEWSYDPNEPRYCICNQVSYGDMVACDNEDCPFEWFHYPCVGITSSPKGKWYCPQCTSSMRRRGGRKN